jgi:hypothetical protein
MLYGANNDGKGQPSQSNAVSHGCPPTRHRQVNVINTGARDERRTPRTGPRARSSPTPGWASAAAPRLLSRDDCEAIARKLLASPRPTRRA